MKAYIDTRLIRKFITVKDLKERESLLNDCCNALKTNDKELEFVLGWPSLFEYLGFGFLFENTPKLDQKNKIFASVVEALLMDCDKEVITYLYDQIFVECLTQVKGLPQIHPKVILEEIRKRKFTLFAHLEDPFTAALNHYEKKFSEDPQNAFHDLTLYLAWDRVCVYLATLFDHTSLKIHNGLQILKECLVESFQHITQHGKTAPGFFRLVEALYAYQMKDENLQKYSEAEWLTLCQSSNALKPREYLADVSYIDASVVEEKSNDKNSLKVLVLDSPEKIHASLGLSDYMLGKLKADVPNWNYSFRPMEIICLQEHDKNLVVESIIQH